MKNFLFLLLSIFCLFTKIFADSSGVVSVELCGQLGNQLFQIATGYAYSLDHNLAFTVPDLAHKTEYRIPFNAKNFFSHKVPSYDPPFNLPQWREPSYNYSPIPFFNFVELQGWLQSEKYFKHRRAEILDLFAMPSQIRSNIIAKYPFLDTDLFVVGIQIRDYRKEQPEGKYHPTIGREYYEAAINLFPSDTLYLVSSNNLEFAKACVQGLSSNIIYLNEDDMQEFFTLTMCKSFIISNSSFGWWAAWLSTYQNKKVVAPTPWFSFPYDFNAMGRDLYPDEWIQIDYKKNNRRSR